MNIFKVMLFLIVASTVPSKGFSQEIPEKLFDNQYLEKILNVGSFNIIKNENYHFNGVLKVGEFGKYKELFCVVGKYREKNKNGYETFVAILSKNAKGFKKEKVFEFFREKIDELQYRDGLIYVVFTGESDNFGWVEWKEGDFSFVVYNDPEL